MLQGTFGRNSGGELANPIPEGAGVSGKFHAVILCVVGRVAASPIASLQLRLHTESSGSPLSPSLSSRAPEPSTSLTPGRTGTVGLASLRAYWARSLRRY